MRSARRRRRRRSGKAGRRCKKRSQLGAKTQRERDYIGAVEIVFKDHDTVPFKPCARRPTKRRLSSCTVRYPEDSEAAVLYAFWLQVTADRNDQTYAQQLKSAKILEKVYAAQPQHPGAAHFLIHAYDFPAIAEHGLDGGEALRLDRPGLAPRPAHAVAHFLPRRAMAGFDRQQYTVTRGVEDGPRRLSRARLHGVRGPAARSRRRCARMGRFRHDGAEAERGDAPGRLRGRGDSGALCARTRGLGGRCATRDASGACRHSTGNPFRRARR